MEIRVGAFDPTEEKCVVYVDLYEEVSQHAGSVKVGVWVDNLDSRSALYLAAKQEALSKLEMAVDALKRDIAK